MLRLELDLGMLEPEVAQAVWSTECRRQGIDPGPIGEYTYKPLSKRQQDGDKEYGRWLAGGVNGTYDSLSEPGVAAAAEAALEEILKAHFENAQRGEKDV